MADDWDHERWPERALSIDFEWRLVCVVERVLEENPHLRPILERALRAQR